MPRPSHPRCGYEDQYGLSAEQADNVENKHVKRQRRQNSSTRPHLVLKAGSKQQKSRIEIDPAEFVGSAC
jgi:hypothetical protein